MSANPPKNLGEAGWGFLLTYVLAVLAMALTTHDPLAVAVVWAVALLLALDRFAGE